MNKELYENIRKYMKNNIIPLYNNVDIGHQLSHIEYVLDRSLKFAAEWNDKHLDNPVDNIKCEIIATYHDVGLAFVDRVYHEKKSAEILKNDKFLQETFSPKDIKEMAEAVEDHRGSLRRMPRSPYGMIISQADRDTDLNHLLFRTFALRCNKQEYREDFHLFFNDVKKHLNNKYGENGYAWNKVWFEDKALNDFRRDVSDVLTDDKLLTDRLLNVVNKYDSKLCVRYKRTLQAEELVSETENAFDIDYNKA